jgi:hypothetical protein
MLPLGFNGESTDRFWEIGSILEVTYPMRHRNTFFESEYFLDPTIVQHDRTVYNLFDVLGDVGGVMQILQIVFAFLLSTYSERAFTFDLLEEITNYKPTFKEKLCKSKKLKQQIEEISENML